MKDKTRKYIDERLDTMGEDELVLIARFIDDYIWYIGKALKQIHK